MPDPHKDFLRELQATFRVEAQEHLQQIESTLVQLEQADAGTRNELADRLLKTLHTLKGAARAVNRTEMERLCHSLESVLLALRGSGGGLVAEQFDLLHRASALARQLLDAAGGRVRNQAAAMTARLEALADGMGQEPQAAAPPTPPAFPACSATVPAADDDAVQGVVAADLVRVRASDLDAIRHQAEALLAVELGLQHQVAGLLAVAEEMHECASQPHSVHREEPVSGGADSFAVRCRRLAADLGRTQRNFKGIRLRLMEATLDAALVPFSSALAPLPALVRQLSRGSGKQAMLEVDSGEVQVDRRILDALREALLHLVTNAVDHGLEPPALRQAAGKSPAGRIQITVAQPGAGRIAVSVADDGAGIDAEAIAEAAVHAGRLERSQLAGLERPQVLRLALQAGVSSRARVTSVSGRGVGLAIVAEKVASVGGELLIDSQAGQGCRFDLQLPVRLATMRGLVVQTHGVRYVLPLPGIERVRALREGDVCTVEGRETLLLGGQVLPAIRLGTLLGLPRSGGAATECMAVVLRAGGHRLALLVDEILAEQEVLPKGLGRQLRRVRFIAGATQLGDGELVLILAPEDIGSYGLQAAAAPRREEKSPKETRRQVLVVEDSITSRLLLKHILEGAGYCVETAGDGLEALSKLRQQVFEAVVSDIEMPRMDGLELTRRLRANPQTRDLPVVLVTSLQSAQERERGLLAGADAYVAKGAFDQDGLIRTLRRLL